MSEVKSPRRLARIGRIVRFIGLAVMITGLLLTAGEIVMYVLSADLGGHFPTGSFMSAVCASLALALFGLAASTARRGDEFKYEFTIAGWRIGFGGQMTPHNTRKLAQEVQEDNRKTAPRRPSDATGRSHYRKKKRRPR
jgi:hypothetical protein